MWREKWGTTKGLAFTQIMAEIAVQYSLTRLIHKNIVKVVNPHESLLLHHQTSWMKLMPFTALNPNFARAQYFKLVGACELLWLDPQSEDWSGETLGSLFWV